LTVANVISDEDNIMEPDVYRLDLPEEMISPLAARSDGPVTGRSSFKPEQAATNTALTTTADLASPPEVTPSLGRGEEGLVTTLVRPQHITVAEAKESLSSEYQQYITTNVIRNVFVYKGPISILKEFKQDLALIDTEPPHILVDLLAVELSDEANRSLGLDWTAAGGSVGVFQPSGKAIRDLTPDSQFNGITTYPGTGQVLYQGVGSLPREFFVRLSALISDDKGTILANPRTVATSGKQSLIQIRKTQNFFFNEGFDTAGRPIVKKSDISSDTQGEITPTLLPDGRIHLVVDVGVGTFTFTTAANLPEQTTRKATTEVTVHEGETIVIGGLRQQEMRKSKTKVPILGSLPIVGRLFRHEEQEVRHSVLTIFITPQVMNGHNLKPAWPRLDPNEHQIEPIMEHKMDGLLD
jgi:type II secretory pathway component GspD/PulD (secretin)